MWDLYRPLCKREHPDTHSHWWGWTRHQIFLVGSWNKKTKEEAEAEAEQKQRYEDAQAVIASLQAEKRLLEKDLQENQKALTDEQNNTKNLRELLEERNLSVESKGLEYMQKTGELQTTITTLQAEIEALHQKIAENEQAYEMLTYQANELENLLSEQQIINRELKPSYMRQR